MSTNPRQISLRQILIVIGLLSVIFALAGPGKLPLARTLMLAASMGVAAGLWQQASDIGRAMTAWGAATDAGAVRTWRFEKRWRYLIASLVFFGWTLAAFIAQGIFGLADSVDAEFRASPTSYADGLVSLVIVFGLASSVARGRGTPRTRAAAWVHRAGWVAGLMLLVVVTVGETAIIDAFVHFAIRGIEMAQPEPYGETFFPGGVWVYKSNVARFAWLQLVLAGAVLINTAMLIRMTGRNATNWSRVGYAISICLALALALWNRFYGFASVSPVLAGAEAFWMAHVWRPAIPLMIFFGFAATYHLLAHPSQPLADRPVWRPEGKIYVSESWCVLAVAVIGSVWHVLTDIYTVSKFGFSIITLSSALEIIASPSHYLHFAVVAVCVQLTIARLREKPLSGQAPMELDLSRFAYTLIAVAMSTYVALEAAIGSSFVYWIIPWQPLPNL